MRLDGSAPYLNSSFCASSARQLTFLENMIWFE